MQNSASSGFGLNSIHLERFLLETVTQPQLPQGTGFCHGYHCTIVNRDSRWSLLGPHESKNKTSKDKTTKDKVPLIDVTHCRYCKGVLPENQPIIVKPKLISKIAEKKMKQAGGAISYTASFISS